MKNSGYGYGYVRVSTIKQAVEGCSIEDQVRRIKAWAEINDIKLMEIYIDSGVSGTFMFERPEFAKLMDALDRKDVLVAYDVSRVSRNSGDTAILLERLKEKEIYAVFIKDGFDTSTMMGQCMAQMTSMMKAIEAAQISERVKDTVEMMKANGQNITRPVYGWKKESNIKGCGLVEVMEQQLVIIRMKQLHKDGLSMNAIATLLSKEGTVPPGKGTKWNSGTVTAIIHRGPVAINGRKRN